MKLLAFSDLHRNLNRAAELVEMSSEADVVIGAGDFASVHEGLEETIDALSAIESADRAGARQQRDRRRPARGHCRTGARPRSCTAAVVTIDGIEFFGLGAGVPVTPWEWSFDLDEEKAAVMLTLCPRERGSSSYTRHRTATATPTAPATTSAVHALLRTIEEKEPRLAVCGHIHESWGCKSKIGKTPVRQPGPERDLARDLAAGDAVPRWVTSGASSTSTCSRPTSARRVLEQARAARRAESGTTLSCISSISPAARYC